MAAKEKETVTLTLKLRRIPYLKAQSIMHQDLLPGISDFNSELFDQMGEMYKWIEKHGNKKLPALINPNLDPSELLREMLKIIYETLKAQWPSWKFILDRYWGILCVGPGHSMDEFGSLEVCSIRQFKELDPEFYNLLIGLLSFLNAGFGYVLLDDMEMYDVVKEEVKDRLKDPEERKENGAELRAILKEAEESDYKLIIKDVKASKMTMHDFIKRIQNIHEPEFPINSRRKQIIQMLQTIASYLKLIGEPFNINFYDCPWVDDPDFDSDNGFKLGIQDRYCIIPDHDGHIWPEMSRWIDDTYNNYGDNGAAFVFGLTHGLPTKEQLQEAQEIEYKAGYFDRLNTALRNLLNDKKLLKSYHDQIVKHNGNNYQKILDKGVTLFSAIPV